MSQIPCPGSPRAFDAWLLVGPTGAGKTPLGNFLERSGWNGRRCLHFDFGAELRKADAGAENVPGLSGEDRNVIRQVLRDGALFEDRHSSLVRKIFDDFLRRRGAQALDLLLLNGWPRHLGQARDLETFAVVRRIVLLNAPAETIRERIRTDAAGDRSVREDDSPDEVEIKFTLYEERTRPLVGYYAAKGIPVTTLEVAAETSAADLHRDLLQRLDGRG
ncbi:MAG: nucleoside monophosphate kinase [Candidatus Aminicenantes bacterium]|nr:nucleoside monophosphate kinase [Candidatus Aminicenantes bacterium]